MFLNRLEDDLFVGSEHLECLGKFAFRFAYGGYNV